jgi:predicted acetyltransferase/GrpB-like predicted nucleotidyltransferase (UPF0157 family)
MARLIAPDVGYEASYRQAVAELVAEGRSDEAAGLENPTFDAFVEHLRDLANGVGLPHGFVAGSTFWLVEDSEYLGRVDVRHELTDALRRFGGHVGYLIRPSRRRQGYGTLALALALPECSALGLDRALVTCDVNNLASRRIIEHNRGMLEDVINVPGRTVPTMRWWIDTSALEAATLEGGTLGLERRTVRLVEADPDWPARFEQLAGPLRDALRDDVGAVEHVGSTAVPGLAAKPILDVVIGLTSGATAAAVVARLTPMGYEFRGDKGDEGGLLFVLDDKPDHRVAHLHVVRYDDARWRGYLNFRDRLRRDPRARDVYSALKRELTQRHADDRAAYTAAKSAFIAELLAEH